MSADQVWFGPSGRKSRSTRSGATLTPGKRTVVRRRLRAKSPEIPAACISRSTRLRPTRIPCSKRSSAWTRRAPYVPFEAAWISLIFSVSHASLSALSEGARRSQSWKLVRFTPSALHITETGKFAFSASISEKISPTARRSPGRKLLPS
jgi:hypothetical protein